MQESEFSLINRLFKRTGSSRNPFTRLGIGDDASIHHLEPGMELVVSTDSSLQGVHWPDDFPLDRAADRAVCSALSDMAAMGAETLCIWLNVMAEHSRAVERMAQGAMAALKRYDVELAGGDTCRSAINALSVSVAGQLPEGTAMRRDSAVSSDNIWLAGRVGWHALGLQQWLNGRQDGAFVPCFEVITPLLQTGIKLRQAGVGCCIDISDGLLQDVGHIAFASGVGMDIEITSVPGWELLCQAVGEDSASALVAHGGEDYALLFTAPDDVSLPDKLAVCIGHCRSGKGVSLLLDGEKTDIEKAGFDHFR